MAAAGQKDLLRIFRQEFFSGFIFIPVDRPVFQADNREDLETAVARIIGGIRREKNDSSQLFHDMPSPPEGMPTDKPSTLKAALSWTTPLCEGSPSQKEGRAPRTY